MAPAPGFALVKSLTVLKRVELIHAKIIQSLRVLRKTEELPLPIALATSYSGSSGCDPWSFDCQVESKQLLENMFSSEIISSVSPSSIWAGPENDERL